MNSVGIDVSKGKSTVAALSPMGEVALPPTPLSINCIFVLCVISTFS